MSWENVVNLDGLALESHETEKSANYHHEWKALSPGMGAKKLGFNVSQIQPGEFSCPYHFHHSEEELFLVIEGTAMLRQANRFREVSKGDLIFFEASAEGAHQLYNHSDQPFRYLAISTLDAFEIAEYPDSGKIRVCRLKRNFQNGAEVEYLKDEADPARYWPKEHLKGADSRA